MAHLQGLRLDARGQTLRGAYAHFLLGKPAALGFSRRVVKSKGPSAQLGVASPCHLGWESAALLDDHYIVGKLLGVSVSDHA
jgi:hypothetical protein